MMDDTMKKLQIFKEQDDYVIRRINEFGTTFERRYSKAGLIEAIQQYKTLGELEKYDIQAGDDLWPLVINTLSERGD